MNPRDNIYTRAERNKILFGSHIVQGILSDKICPSAISFNILLSLSIASYHLI